MMADTPSDVDAQWTEFDRLRARAHALDQQIVALCSERNKLVMRIEWMLVHIPPRVNYE